MAESVSRARTASWVAITLLVLGLLGEIGAGLVLDHYAAQGRGNDVRILLVVFWGGYALWLGAMVAGVVAVFRRPRHWTTWTVLAIVVVSAVLWFFAPAILRVLLG